MNDFLGKLAESTGLDMSDVRLSELNVNIRQDTLEIVLVCPEEKEKALTDDIKLIETCSNKILGVMFKVRVKIKKSYFDEAYFTYALLGFLQKYPLIKHNIKSGNFQFDRIEDEIKVTLKAPSAVCEYIRSRNIFGEIKNFIFNNYCEKISLDLEETELENEDIDVYIPEKKLVYDYEGGRKIKVTNVESFIGDPIYERPGYIADVRQGDGIVLCGTIKDFTERKRAMKEGDSEQKYFFKFRLEDFTGSVNCIYFPTKKSLDKIRLLGDGKEIVAFGTVESNTFKGETSLSFRVRFISLCTLPKDFVVNRARMVVPDRYARITPVPYENYEQDDIFRQKEETPPFLIGKKFVVFDLETTGLDRINDRIIEIGAVKIEDGVMTQTFSTLVDPECLIPEKIVGITHITDADVKGKPLIEEVMPDFYKFCDGATMVGQNSIQFDVPFLRAKAEPMNIYFENDQLDTMLLAKKFYPGLSKYTLDFLSKTFGFVNEEAHRAVSDAVTTAKIFIKLAACMK